ncbi:MAG: heme o synthase [Longimicrobiales bacterium]
MSPATAAGAAARVEPAPTVAVRARSGRLSAFLALTKPGITRLVVLTAAVGFYLGAEGAIDWWRFAQTLFGVALAAGGANALNQVAERDVDARMARTRTRPLPSRRLGPAAALAFALALALGGTLFLLAFVGATPALLVAASIVSYVLVYTPLKRVTSLCTLVGAVPGALPILAGWAGTGEPLSLAAWSLFWILFFWQIPHFLALAWLHRGDYARGGFRMLTLDDPDGRTTGRQVLLYGVALVPVSLLPTLLGLTGTIYYVGALLLGGIFLGLGVAMTVGRSERRARRLFLGSVLYLPGLLALMVVDKL